MERSEGVVKGQLEEEKVKGPKIQAAEESDPGSESNPFILEPDNVIKLLKLVESVSQLKELRLMSQTWDQLILNDLEERAFNGKVKAIDFIWTKEFRTKSEAEANLDQFMRDTHAISRLFTSFEFNFPESWIIFCKNMEFFSIYPVTSVFLDIPSWILKQELFVELLTKFIETDIVANLKEITVCTFYQPKEIFGLPSSSLFVPDSGNMERKLKKIDIKFNLPLILGIFKSAFASGKYTNLTSMGLAKLPSGDLDFPGLDLTKLTRLGIGHVGYGSLPALEFTSGLINLARNGMILKDFEMCVNLTPRILQPGMNDFFFDNLAIICSNLTQFLTSQSSTLETLNFGFVCHMDDPVEVEEVDIWCKIHLPNFEALHTLELKVEFKLIEANPRRTHTQIFGMTHNPSGHFPKLINLTLNGESSLIALKVNPAPDEAGQLHLKSLRIHDNHDYDPNAIWSTSFVGVIGSVEDLFCPAKLLYGENRLPWEESLRWLVILHFIRENGKVDEEEIFKLNHLKKVETLVAISIDRRDLGVERFGLRNVENYLNTFKEATELSLTFIKFVNINMEEEFKEKYIEYFPFPVQFP